MKWLGKAFYKHYHAELVRDSARVPGVTPGESGLVIVTRSGVASGVTSDLVWGPEEVLDTWA